MLASSIPTKIVLPFANNAGGSYINVVPVPSQIGITNGAASFYDGFPPNTFVALAAGGAGPFGKDFNGLLNVMSAWERWYCAGGPITYDSAFQGASQVGGYPSGAIVQSATTPGLYWRSVADNNTTDPDSAGAGWVPMFNSATVGSARGLTGSATGGSKTAGWTVQELIAETALGGVCYKGVNLTLSLNIGTSGVNGVDNGTLSASAEFSVYAIYNPTSNTWATLACGASSSNGQTYTGSYMPSGYVASALIYTGKLDGSANIIHFGQQDRDVDIAGVRVLTAGTSGGVIDLSPVVPANARTVSGNFNGNAPNGPENFYVFSDTSSTIGAQIACIPNTGADYCGPFLKLKMFTAQRISWSQQPGTVGDTVNLDVNGYSF